jgi:hypothetical protein
VGQGGAGRAARRRSVAPPAQCPALERVDLTDAQHPTDVDVLLESGTVTVVGATP